VSAILNVRELEKTFGSLIAAHNINIAVPPLQTVGIIGANGAGKTTFVNMITGHLRPTKGSIWFEGRDITGRPSREITRLGIARSFQVPQIFASLTVLENICTATAIARTTSGLIHQALTPLHSSAILADSDSALELFRIAGYRHALAATLPQGARKLLDIAMAIAGAPRVVLLDEPTSGISIEEKFDLMAVVIAALKRRGITVLFVEHDMDIVERYADRVLAFYDGTVIADGPPVETLENPRIQELISGPKLKLAVPNGRHA
jgi:branched-chain amino acid transport system ATP-binding protein